MLKLRTVQIFQIYKENKKRKKRQIPLKTDASFNCANNFQDNSTETIQQFFPPNKHKMSQWTFLFYRQEKIEIYLKTKSLIVKAMK